MMGQESENDSDDYAEEWESKILTSPNQPDATLGEKERRALEHDKLRRNRRMAKRLKRSYITNYRN